VLTLTFIIKDVSQEVSGVSVEPNIERTSPTTLFEERIAFALKIGAEIALREMVQIRGGLTLQAEKGVDADEVGKSIADFLQKKFNGEGEKGGS